MARRPEGYGLATDAAAVDARHIDANVLFADIRNFTALAERLSSAEVAQLLSA